MKKTLSLLLCITLVMSLFLVVPVTVSAAYQGSGTEQDPYLLSAEDLKAFEGGQMGDPKKDFTYYKLTGNATLDKPIMRATNMCLDGDGYTVTLNNITESYNSADNKFGGSGMFALGQGNAKPVTIKNLVITGSVTGTGTSTSYYGVGAVIGLWMESANLTIENVDTTNVNLTLKANTSASAVAAGGLVGVKRVANTTLTITDSTFSGTVTAEKAKAGGLVGDIYDISTVNIERCANFGAITGTTVASGIINTTNTASTVINIKKSFNVSDNIICPNGAVAAIVHAGGYKPTVYVEDCFNTGDVKTNNANKKSWFGYFALGSIKNCYNIGASYYMGVTATGYVTSLENVYCLENSVTDKGLATSKTAEELANLDLATAFSSENGTWEYVNGSEYKYPQLVGNTYKEGVAGLPETLETTVTPFVCNESEDISGTYAGDEEITYTGKYIFAFATAADIEGYEKTFGMEIEKDGKVETVNAVPGSDLNGKFGIIFYGTNLTSGTYTIRPFAVYTLNGESETIYGTSTTATVE